MTVENHFAKLDQSLLKYIFLKSGNISEFSSVCKLFHESVKTEAQSLMGALKDEFGENCLRHVLSQIPCEEKSDAAKIDRLFFAACQQTSVSSSMNTVAYDVKALRQYMKPLELADDYRKLWEALLKTAPSQLKGEMEKVTLGKDILANAETIRQFIKNHSVEVSKVPSLNLSSQKLHVLPSEIIYFSGLTQLDISNNLLTELPEEIGNLKRLTEFRVNGNLLNSLPRTISQLIQLTNFQCGNNRLTCFPMEICKMTKLRTLTLSNNRIERLPEEIGNLKSLNYLYLDSCAITSLPTSINAIQYLIGLYLFNNQLSDLPDTLCELKHINYLSLQNNQLSALPDKIGGLTSLLSLFVDGNRLQELPQSLSTLTKLKQLSISKNQISILPDGMQNLSQLTYFDYANNSIKEFPQGIEKLPFWSLNPNLYPHLINGIELVQLNASITPAEFATTYWGLGEHKWKEGIDGVHHPFGQEVYDRGLHGKYAEPGYLNGIKRAHQFLSLNFNRKIDAPFYLALHSAACSHFKGKVTNTLMGKNKVGVFRGKEDVISATFAEPDYLMTQSAINEFNDLNAEITLNFGSSFRIGDLVLKSKKPRTITIYYQNLSNEQVAILFNYFLTHFYYDIGHANNDESKIKAILKVTQRLEWLHGVRDGCGRTDTALFDYLLTLYGFNPVLLKLPYITSCKGINELVPLAIAGMQEWKNEKAQIDANS